MKLQRLFIVFIALLLGACLSVAKAQNFVNLTPKPYALNVTGGEMTLPKSFAISTNNLPDSIVVEANTFATFSSGAYKVKVKKASAKALMQMTFDKQLAHEAYMLDITPSKISIKAGSSAGFFYGFQSVRKMLTPDGKLPLCRVNDKPRFGYRGFMLDVARHYFTVEQLKKMIDLMARYKLNFFHWHLTEDQAWRIEIKKYPRLTSVGAWASNSYGTSKTKGAYWTNEPYGPFFYTQEEAREIVRYAKARHIEVIPEIDMPGHFTAAMKAYPEFSCTPNGRHEIPTWGGVYTDVLNVANPKAVQFAKDVLAEIIDIFPYKLIHIGGDECPTKAWEENAECQALYKALNLKSYRELQSRFIQDITQFIQNKGREVAVWNEAITEKGADLEMMKRTNATVFCWMPAVEGARKAAELGLKNIFTPWGPYYINRRQSNAWFEKTLPGNGADSLRATYNTLPVPADLPVQLTPYYTGVQATFWTEHVADTEMLEYLALPRLFAVAEAGWTPQDSKNYDDFVERIKADIPWLKANKFDYCDEALK